MSKEMGRTYSGRRTSQKTILPQFVLELEDILYLDILQNMELNPGFELGDLWALCETPMKVVMPRLSAKSLACLIAELSEAVGVRRMKSSPTPSFFDVNLRTSRVPSFLAAVAKTMKEANLDDFHISAAPECT